LSQTYKFVNHFYKLEALGHSKRS